MEERRLGFVKGNMGELALGRHRRSALSLNWVSVTDRESFDRSKELTIWGKYRVSVYYVRGNYG
jgi:hypothetical protein